MLPNECAPPCPPNGAQAGPFARFIHMPATEGRLVTVKECWAADNYVETATFPTLKEAQHFARKRWGWRGFRDNVEECPHCAAQLQGEPIQPQHQHLYGATHLSRKIGHTSLGGADRIERWSCPDCGGEWDRV